jgi:hypothetical protein
MEQLSSGKVMSLLETMAVTCVSGQTTATGLEDRKALYPLISAFAHPLIHARYFPRRNLSRLRRKRSFLAPHLRSNPQNPWPIREADEISAPSYAYQRGQEVIIHFFDDLSI